MTNLRSSAAYRIAFVNFIVFAAGLAVLGVIVFAAMHAAFTRQLDAIIADETQSLVDEYRSGGMRELGEEIDTREKSHSPARMLYAVFDPNGIRIAGGLQTQRPRRGLHDIQFIDGSEGADAGRALVVDLSPNERLVVAADREWIERIDTTVIEVFGAAFAAASLLGLAGAVIFGGYLRRRLRLISQTAEAIIGGDRQKRMPVSERRDEFDELASTLNRMLDRIETLVENLRQVSSDIAHDLRTPLARLRTRLEQGSRMDGGDDPSAILEDAIRRVDDVLSLFAAILRISEVESGQTRRFFGLVDLSLLTTELAESYAPAIQDEGRTLLWAIEDEVRVHGDRELISQAIINLIENAQHHTPQGTVIRLTLVTADAWACVGVNDNGPGVPICDLDRIKQRFTRLDASRNQSGFGLGLSLVNAVADLHGGQLTLRGAEPGLSAIIELPRRTGDRLAVAKEKQEDSESMSDRGFVDGALSKVPAVTLGFWIIKILATTLGETGGDTVTMTWLGETTPHPVPFGYLIGTAIFGVLLIGFVIAQIRARSFNRWLYWATIVASTTCGTALADFADRSLGIGYPGGSLLLLACVLLSLFAWWRAMGTINVNTVSSPREETFYWITITFSQTLGTALGDWSADPLSDGGWGLGYSGGALVFGAGLAVLALLYFNKRVSRVFLFWAAFILTRPLGATVGDFLDKPLNKGGLELSRPIASAALAIVIIFLIVILPQRPGRRPKSAEATA